MNAPDTGRWIPLTYYLRLKLGRQPELEMTFRQIEAVLGDGLPKPARRHAAWWQNDAGAPQARAWLDAGWQVATVELEIERVTFSPAGAL